MLDVLRAAGVSCSGYDGWENRSRSSGGFSGFYGVVCHHTASKTTPANDLAYMVNGSPDNPVSNGLLDRTGHFTCIAAGASNHAGKGGGSTDGGGGTPWYTSSGQVPPSSANSYCFGIEAANDGVGEPWPQAQTDAYVKMCAALADAYGFVVGTDYRSHAEWTPPRKIDPRGPSPWQPANASTPWDMNAFRADVLRASGPLPPDQEDDFVFVTWKDKRYGNVFLLGEGGATQVDTPTLQALQPSAKAQLEGQHDQTLACCCTQAWGITGSTPAEVINAAYQGGYLV